MQYVSSSLTVNTDHPSFHVRFETAHPSSLNSQPLFTDWEIAEHNVKRHNDRSLSVRKQINWFQIARESSEHLSQKRTEMWKDCRNYLLRQTVRLLRSSALALFWQEFVGFSIPLRTLRRIEPSIASVSHLVRWFLMPCESNLGGVHGGCSESASQIYHVRFGRNVHNKHQSRSSWRQNNNGEAHRHW
jgi:hypothetical protein